MSGLILGMALFLAPPKMPPEKFVIYDRTYAQVAFETKGDKLK